MGRYAAFQGYYLIEIYHSLLKENESLQKELLVAHRKVESLQGKKTSDEILYERMEEEKMATEANVETTSEVAENVALSHKQFIKNMAMIGIFATGITVGAQSLIRYVVLQNVEAGEEGDRLNNAQILGAIAGGLAGVYAEPAFNIVKKATKGFYQGCQRFFKSGTSTPVSPDSVQTIQGEDSNRSGQKITGNKS